MLQLTSFPPPRSFTWRTSQRAAVLLVLRASEKTSCQLVREVSRLLRFAGGRTRIVLPESRTSVRSASFTAAESGKISATSGDKRTRFVPVAYRAAYLPRTPPENSISGTAEAEEDLLLFFRILTTLTPTRVPSTKNARDISALCVANDQEIAAIRHAEEIVPPFAFRMLWIWHRDGVPIRKCRRRFVERHAVLSEVLRRLLRIPLELHVSSLREGAVRKAPSQHPGQQRMAAWIVKHVIATKRRETNRLHRPSSLSTM